MDLSPLFQPYRLGGLTLANRFVMSPMQKHEPPDLIPNDEMVEYYRCRIKGGVGLIMTQGVTMDHPTSTAPYASFIPRAYDGWKRCVDVVRENGGHIFPQLWHEGAHRAGGFGPSGLSGWGEAQGHALTRQQIAELVEVYAKSAYDAQQLGFSGVEIHGAHGYLVDQFFMPISNKREDEYGGSPENRMRFALDIVRAIRAAVGSDFPISMRVSQWKNRDFDAKPCPTPEALTDFLTPLKKAGVDVFHASARRFWVPEYDGSDMGYAGWVKKQSGLPVIAVGSVGLTNDLATNFYAGNTVEAGGQANFSELIRRFNRGDFDLVAIGRTILTDPEWVNKVRDGRFDDLKKSVSLGDILGDLSLQLPKNMTAS
jgi:2,4-dienoyl-CoA reductase-like NADH-dependent reductase (Old Yellow Enzyme family)